MRIMMIRHFQTPGNLERRYIGRTDEPLLQNEALLKLVEEKRRLLGAKGVPQQVVASPLKRCIQTAAHLFPGKEPFLCEELKECDFGLFEAKNYQELKDLSAYQKWLDSRGELPFPEGEAHEDFKARCVRGFEKTMDELIRHGCELAAMVVHGGTIMAVLSRFDKEQREFYHWQVENGGGYLITLDEKDWEEGRKVFREIERL